MLTKTQNNIISYGSCLIVFPISIVYFNTGHLPALTSRPGIACILWSLHFLRRTLEAAFVEKHSSQPIPLLDSISEFIYYWVFGSWIAYAVCQADLTQGSKGSEEAPWYLTVLRPILPVFCPLPLALLGWISAETTNWYVYKPVSLPEKIIIIKYIILHSHARV